jgi:hypothetical protein
MARHFAADADFTKYLHREQDAADETARYALRFIQSIPQALFNERVAMALISAVQARVEHSNFKHMEHGEEAAQSLADAHLTLENKADAMTHDAANEDAGVPA